MFFPGFRFSGAGEEAAPPGVFLRRGGIVPSKWFPIFPHISEPSHFYIYLPSEVGPEMLGGGIIVRGCGDRFILSPPPRLDAVDHLLNLVNPLVRGGWREVTRSREKMGVR